MFELCVQKVNIRGGSGLARPVGPARPEALFTGFLRLEARKFQTGLGPGSARAREKSPRVLEVQNFMRLILLNYGFPFVFRLYCAAFLSRTVCKLSLASFGVSIFDLSSRSATRGGLGPAWPVGPARPEALFTGFLRLEARKFQTGLGPARPEARKF